MILIIDGYNLLKHIYPREKGKLGKQRDKLIRQLGFYKSKKADGIKQIVLVFDGGEWGRATREVRSGVVVVFSGQKQSADDWIADFVVRNKGKEQMLVTRDRELIKRCKGAGVESINTVDFYEVLQAVLLEGVGQDLGRQDGSVQKYGNDGDIESEALDILMEQASTDLCEKDDAPVVDRKKGRSYTPSKKKEKKLLKKIKKL